MTFLVGGIDAFDPVSVGTLNGLAANQHPSRHGTIVLSAHKRFLIAWTCHPCAAMRTALKMLIECAQGC
jgi:hypothetical protein